MPVIQEFAPVAAPVQQWRRLALAAMQRTGRAGPDTTPDQVDALLATTTYDGITVPALYTPDTAAPSVAVPAGAAYPVLDGWQVRQRYVPAELGADLTGEVAAFAVPAGLPAADWDALPLRTVAVYLDQGADPAALFAAATRGGVTDAALTGNLGTDPLVTTGPALRCADRYPGLRSATVDAVPYAEAGASDADVLACATATGVAYLRALTSAGLDLRTALGQLEFRFAVTADQFAVIGMLRAARVMWMRVAQECGAPDAGAQLQHAVTSAATTSLRDPDGDILRSTVACFAAVTGGAGSVTVRPHVPGAAGHRLARTLQAVLRDEAQLHRVSDPAAGSWYVEALTGELAERGWHRFQEIERYGGMPAALSGGLIAGWTRATWRRRLDDLSHRRTALIGVTRFPAPAPPATGRAEVEVAGKGEVGVERSAAVAGDGEVGVEASAALAGKGEIGALLPALAGRRRQEAGLGAVATGERGAFPVRRLAAPFERLRDRVDAHAASTGSVPTVLIVPLGTVKERAARVGWVTELFAVGGIATRTAPTEVDELKAALQESPVVCLCGPDTAYAESAEVTVEELEAAGARRVWLAGKPGHLVEGCDVLAALEVTLADLGVA